VEVLSVFIRYILFLTFSTISLFSSVSSNPFLRPGSKQKPPQNKPVIIPKSVSRPNVAKELDFKGYFILNGQPFFSLFNKKVNHSEWVSLSEKTYEEFMPQSFDVETETLTILYEGQTFDLKLIDAKSGSGLPNSGMKSPSLPKSISGVGKVKTPKIMPPKPTFTPTIPSNVVTSSTRSSPPQMQGFSSSSFKPSRNMPALSLPGLPYPGAVPRRTVSSNPTSLNNNPSNQNLNGNNKNPSFDSRSNSNKTPNNSQLSNEKAINDSSNDSIDLLNLPPPPPPPNILPPSPPPDIKPARE
jgi:hypothetical protein